MLGGVGPRASEGMPKKVIIELHLKVGGKCFLEEENCTCKSPAVEWSRLVKEPQAGPIGGMQKTKGIHSAP